MRDTNLDNELKILSQYVYHDDKIKLPKGYTKILTTENSKNGFYAQAFYNGKDIVIAYRGTDIQKGITNFKNDARNDVSMVRHELPNQTADAINLYKKLKQEYPNKNFVLTGHSLGGSLAQIVGSITGAKSVSFEPYGTKNDKALAMKYYKNISNYGNIHDSVYTYNKENQVGERYELNNKKGVGYPFKYHGLENMGDLKDAVKDNNEIKPNKDNLSLLLDLMIQNEIQKLANKEQTANQNINTSGNNGDKADGSALKASIDYNVDKNDNRVFTREDLKEMSKEEQTENHDAIMKQYHVIGIPTRAEVIANDKKSKYVIPSHRDAADGLRWVTINGNHVLL